MGHTSLCVLGLLLLNKLLNCGRAEGLDAVLTVKPNWPTLFHRESVTFTCDLTEGKDTDWKYTFTGNGSRLSLCGTEKSCSYKLMKNSSGDYQCTGRHKSRNLTAESKIVSLNVAVNSRPVLTVSPSWLSAGASVTLKCSAEDPSAGWRFYWFKAIPKLPNISYSYELLPGSSSGTEQDSYIVHGQKHTAGYVCRAGRGDPVFYTYYSKPKFVWSGDIHLASLRVSPDRVQHFPSESVSLSCEGNSTEWRMMRFTKAERLSNCSDFGTVNGCTCNVHNFTNNTAVYWCESGSGQFSNAVNITVQNTNIILLSPVHPVTEGHPVTLGCKWRTENLVSNVLFYRNGHLIQNDTRGQLNISEVSKSDEGFHWCEHSGNVSPQSWVAVKLSRPETSSVILPVIIGLVCGMSILLLLWCCCRKSKYLLFARTMLSQKANQNSANQDGSQSKVHPSHQSGADETSDGIYSLIQIKYFGSGERVSPGPTVETVYSEVKLAFNSPFPVPLITGLVVGILLIVPLPLLLLCWYRKSKGTCCHRLIMCQGTNQSSATVHTVNQDENQQQVYSSLLHGDFCVYETISGSGNTGSGERSDECRRHTSQIQLKGLGKRGMHDDSAESSDYSNVNPDSGS